MDFLLWIVRGIHLFGVVVWFGGLMYQSAVVLPVAQVEERGFDSLTIHLLGRFQPLVWMCVWTVLITGFALMMFDPRFVFFRYDDRWSVLLGIKQVVSLAMIFFSAGYARMFARVTNGARRNDPRESVLRFYQQMLLFGKINVALAIVAMLLVAGMHPRFAGSD